MQLQPILCCTAPVLDDNRGVGVRLSREAPYLAPRAALTRSTSVSSHPICVMPGPAAATFRAVTSRYLGSFRPEHLDVRACRVGRMTVPSYHGIFARDYSPDREPTLAGAPRLAPMCQSRCARQPPSDIRERIARCTPGRNSGPRTRGRVLVIAGRCSDERWVIVAHHSQPS